MLQRVEIGVYNCANDHCHFKRALDLPDGVSLPLNQILEVLYWLFQGLDIVIRVNYNKFNEKM